MADAEDSKSFARKGVRVQIPLRAQVDRDHYRYHPGVDRPPTTQMSGDRPADDRLRGHFLQPEWDGTDSIRERFESVKDLIRGSSVLDVGCASRHRRADWLHGLIAEQCSDLVGIDLDETAVEKLRADGHDIRLGDARDFDLGRKFEVVWAGEVIEHIDDMRGFLQSVKRHLEPNGRLVLTTPNAFYLGNFVYRLGGHARVHPEHTCWYCEDTLRRALEMNGYDQVDITFIGHSTPSRPRAAIGAMARGVLPPRLALDTLVAVARPGI
jgi:2-polyprenyl-3-methyl-5-hydroxy-6-metoxy-1,4-benzoquinol methylase